MGHVLSRRLGAVCYLGVMLLLAPAVQAAPGAGGRDFAAEAAAAAASGAGKRVALVIGNGSYQHVKALENPGHDADDVAAELRRFGFDVLLYKNLKKRDMRSAVAEFGRRASGAAATLFYYAGHGIQVKNQNYLMPVDASAQSEADVADEGINLNFPLEEMEGAGSKVNIVLLDACRNNPMSGRFRSGDTRGLATPNIPRGTVIVYATSPGDVAEDGKGRNGTFTSGLLTAFKGNDLSLDGVLTVASAEVERQTANKQVPYVNGPQTLKKLFRFAVTVDPGPRQVEGDFWASIKDSRDPADFDAYLQQFPQGSFRRLAENRLKVLQASAAPVAVVAPVQPVYTPPAPANTGYAVGQTFRDCPDCPEMVVIPPGSFMMGPNDGESNEKPVHQVNINYRLAVGKYEVTFAEWDACVAAGGCSHKPDDKQWGRGRRPVMNVSWNDAQDYVHWLSQKTGKEYRLLSEAEWEYAARAGTTTRYSFGDSESQLGKYAWYDRNWVGKTQPVGQKRPNPFGLFDMHGNVYEWVQDCYQNSYTNAPTDGGASNKCASDARRVLRGGSWGSIPDFLRAAYRNVNSPGLRSDIVGFRLARTRP